MPKTNVLWGRVWGQATAIMDRARKIGWVDVLVILGLAGLFFGFFEMAGEWTGPHRESVEIDLGLVALPRYTFFSLCRGLLAYVISLAFTLGYGYWAAKDQVAERLLIPLLDILQSIPVLGFLPGLLIALSAAFPSSNIGLELASVLMIFTGQAWNMTFSFFHSLRALPLDQREVATVYRFNVWQRFKWVELPYSMIGLVWNSMMSMAGGWFFLMICESFRLGSNPGEANLATLGATTVGMGSLSLGAGPFSAVAALLTQDPGTDFRLPGLGSYMSVAVDQGDVRAMLWAVAAMVLMIVALDQLFWRPVVVWAQKFRVEEGGSETEMKSWFLDWLRRSRLLAVIGSLLHGWHWSRESSIRVPVNEKPETKTSSQWATILSLVGMASLIALLSYGVWNLVILLLKVHLGDWAFIIPAAGATLGRVLISTAIGTLWALPAGLAIGLSPRLSRIFQPIVQVVASFPAPMLFPLVIAGLHYAGVTLGWGSILLMLLGTQWYILFNIIAGAMAVPADLREAARSYRLNTWQRFWSLYLPAVFPHLVTGWVTAAGGAWNTSIVAELVTFKGETQETWGLGALINKATEHRQFPLLAASILVMAAVVVLFNRTVWRRLFLLAEERFSLNK